MSVLRHYKMTARPGEGPALRAALLALANRVRALGGCSDVEILRDPRDPSTYVFIEHWRSIDDHEASGKQLGRAAFEPVLALLAGPPDGRYLEAIPSG